MQKLTTPPERFNDLPEYPFQAHYLTIETDLQMHYVAEGPIDADTILCLHGEPSWSFLYRKMIPIFVNAGFKIIAPDLIGFGKSDKLIERSAYSYQKHEKWLSDFITKLDLKNIHLFCQDWGGLLGLRIATKMKERFKSITAANTFLPTGQNKVPKAFLDWQKFSQTHPAFSAGAVLNMATVSKLSEAVINAYDAPFPDESYKAGSRIFPMLVPIDPDDPEAIKNVRIWEQLKKWDKPFLTLFSDSDPIMAGGEKIFQKLVPGCKNQPHTIIKNAGHFLQEDKGEEIAAHVVQFIQNLTAHSS